MKHLFNNIIKFAKANKFLAAIIIGIILIMIASNFTDKPILNWVFGLFGETGDTVGFWIMMILAGGAILYTLYKIGYMIYDSIRDAKKLKKQ